jgi:hypothetical protein
MKQKKYFLEALASFFVVGLGQLIKGDGQKAVNLLLVFYFVLPALVYCSLLVDSFIFIFVFGCAVLLGLIIWLYNIGDALVRS